MKKILTLALLIGNIGFVVAADKSNLEKNNLLFRNKSKKTVLLKFGDENGDHLFHGYIKPGGSFTYQLPPEKMQGKLCASLRYEDAINRATLDKRETADQIFNGNILKDQSRFLFDGDPKREIIDLKIMHFIPEKQWIKDVDKKKRKTGEDMMDKANYEYIQNAGGLPALTSIKKHPGNKYVWDLSLPLIDGAIALINHTDAKILIGIADNTGKLICSESVTGINGSFVCKLNPEELKKEIYAIIMYNTPNNTTLGGLKKTIRFGFDSHRKYIQAIISKSTEGNDWAPIIKNVVIMPGNLLEEDVDNNPKAREPKKNKRMND